MVPERELKILHLDTGKGWRGGQQQLFWLLQGLRERGQEQLLLAPAGSPLVARVREKGLEAEELSPRILSFANLRALRQKAGRDDLIHAHDSRGHLLGWLAGVGRRKKTCPRLVVSRRVTYPIGYFSQLKYGAADAYIAVSEYVSQQLLMARVPKEKIHVVHDGVKLPDAPVGSGERREFRGHFGAGEQTFLIGALTSLAPEKLLRDGVNLLANLPPNVHLWLGHPASEPDQQAAEKALLEYARKRGLEQRFQIFQLGKNLNAFLGALDLFMYLSRAEGLGSAILLAMAHGLPVVANSVGGIPEIVRHMETGVLVGRNLEAELPPAIQFLMGSPEIRQRLAAAGQSFVSTHATTDIMVAQTAAVYGELLQGSYRNRE